ncbi:hypothetical protein ACK3TF_000377 [Chlorella vulgaris]
MCYRGLTLLLLLLTALGAAVCQQQPQQQAQAGPTPGFSQSAAATDGGASSAPFGASSEPSGQFGLAASIGSPAGEPRLQFQGTATVAYSPDPLTPYQAVGLGCGLGFVSPTFQTNYVGVSSEYFDNAQACGRCITLQCDDQSCAEPGKELPALVVDVCGSCSGSDLSIAIPLFKNLTGRDAGSNPSIVVSWDLISCAPYTVGTIKMLVKAGGSAFFQAFGFSNYVVPIAQVQVNGTRLQQGSDGFYSYNPGSPIDPSAPLAVALLGANREVLRATVPSLRSADLGFQFTPQA